MQFIYFKCSAISFPELKLLSHKLFTEEVNEYYSLQLEYVNCFSFQNCLPVPMNLVENYINCGYIK